MRASSWWAWVITFPVVSMCVSAAEPVRPETGEVKPTQRPLTPVTKPAPVTITDDFQTDSRSQYEITGEGKWEKAHLVLESSASLATAIPPGLIAELRSDVQWSAATDGDAACIAEIGYRYGADELAVQIRPQGAGQGDAMTEVRVIARTLPQRLVEADLARLNAGHPVREIRRFRLLGIPERTWRLAYRDGLIRIELGAGMVGLAFDRVETALLKTAFLRSVASRLEVRNVMVRAEPEKVLTPREKLLLAEANRLAREFSDLHSQGKYREALPRAQRSLQLEQEIHGSLHPSCGARLSQLAELHRQLGNDAQAESLFIQAGDVERLKWEYLAGTADEIHAVERLWPGPPAPDVLRDSAASETALRNAMPRSRFIHLASYPPLPPHGLLVKSVTPESNAAMAGLERGDVVLSYDGTVLNAMSDLQTVAAAEENIPLKVWRDGKTNIRTVRPGKLGLVLDNRPAPIALQEERKFQQILLAARAASGDGPWGPLAGSAWEVASLARLTEAAGEPVRKLLGLDASEQAIYELAASGELAKYRLVHLATHGRIDNDTPQRSALIVTDVNLPDPLEQVLNHKPPFDGRISVEEIVSTWRLNADLVTLSACQTALGKHEGGEGFVGFTQALLLAGADTLCLSLWEVDDTATALLMDRFYANLLGQREGLEKPLSKSAALADAQT